MRKPVQIGFAQDDTNIRMGDQQATFIHHVGRTGVLEELVVLLVLGRELLDAGVEAQPGHFELLELLRHPLPPAVKTTPANRA